MKNVAVLSLFFAMVCQWPLYGSNPECYRSRSFADPGKASCFSVARLRHAGYFPKQALLSISEKSDSTGRSENSGFAHPYQRAFIGNYIGIQLGGLAGGVLMRLRHPDQTTGFFAAVETIAGIYIGSMIGSGLGSAFALYSRSTWNFGKILLRSFIPPAVSFGISLLSISSGLRAGEYIFLGTYIAALILTPINAARAYQDYNPPPPAALSRLQQSERLQQNRPAAGAFMFSVTVEF
ncbi:MAG: hypothetical protein WAN36_07515 [Calditrichia bacterium]